MLQMTLQMSTLDDLADNLQKLSDHSELHMEGVVLARRGGGVSPSLTRGRGWYVWCLPKFKGEMERTSKPYLYLVNHKLWCRYDASRLGSRQHGSRRRTLNSTNDSEQIRLWIFIMCLWSTDNLAIHYKVFRWHCSGNLRSWDNSQRLDNGGTVRATVFCVIATDEERNACYIRVQYVEYWADPILPLYICTWW